MNLRQRQRDCRRSHASSPASSGRQQDTRMLSKLEEEDGKQEVRVDAAGVRQRAVQPASPNGEYLGRRKIRDEARHDDCIDGEASLGASMLVPFPGCATIVGVTAFAVVAGCFTALGATGSGQLPAAAGAPHLAEEDQQEHCRANQAHTNHAAPLS